MKSRLVLLAALLGAWGSAFAQGSATNVFFLRPEGTGTVYGPFIFQDGARVVIGKQSYVIEKLGGTDVPPPPARPVNPQLLTKLKLERLVIPEINCREARLDDIIKLVDQLCRQVDTESPPAEKGVNIVLSLRVPKTDQFLPMPVLTISLRNRTALEVIQCLARISDLSYRIENNVVWIEPSENRIKTPAPVP
jgi:hypothetical protein